MSAGRTNKRIRKAITVPVIALSVIVALTGTAVAFFTATGNGNGYVLAKTISKPQNFVASAVDEDSINLTWNPPANTVDGMTYEVERDGVNICTTSELAARNCNDNGLDPDTEYDYTVEATRGAWTSGTVSASATTGSAPVTGALTFTSTSVPCGATLGSGVTTWTSKISRPTASATPLTVNLSRSGTGTLSATSVTIAASQTESELFTVSGITSGFVTVTAAATGYTDINCTINAASAPATPSFQVGSIAQQTAGSAFSVTITAKAGNVTDTTYNGVQSLVFSGPSAAPDGTAPTYPSTATSVTFTNGVGTATGIKLYEADPATTLTVTQGTRSGTAAAFVVAAAAPSKLFFSNCAVNGGTAGACPANVTALGNNGFVDFKLSVSDTYGNVPVTQAGWAWTVTVSHSNTTRFTLAQPTNQTITGPATESESTWRITLNGTAGGNTNVSASATSAGGAPAVSAPSIMNVAK